MSRWLRPALCACLCLSAATADAQGQAEQNPAAQNAAARAQAAQEQAALRTTLLAQAAEAARNISDTRNRVYALTQVGATQSRWGDAAGARASFTEAFALFDAMRVDVVQKQGIGMLFAHDYDTALLVASRFADPTARDRMYEQILRFGFNERAWDPAQAGELFNRFQGVDTRERALLHVLESRSRSCDEGSAQWIYQRMTLPQFRAMALAVVAQCEARKGGPSAATFADAIELALAAPHSAFSEITLFPVNCSEGRKESAADGALLRIAQLQADSNQWEAARETASRMQSETSRSTFNGYLARQLASRRKTEEALAVVQSLPTPACRASVLRWIAVTASDTESLEAALRLVPSPEFPEPRAGALSTLGSHLIVMKHKEEGLALLADALEAALQIPSPFSRVMLATSIANLQSSAGETAAAHLTLQRLQAIVQQRRRATPPEWPGAMGAIANALARAPFVDEALAIVAKFDAGNRAPALRTVAGSQARFGAIPNVLAWVNLLGDPFEKCFALLGVVDGMPEPRPAPSR